MSQQLLHKTLRAYILVALSTLLIASPLFYYFTNKLFIDDADEALLLHKKEFVTKNLPHFKASDVAFWNQVSRDVKIEPALPSLTTDSLFYRFYLDTLANENEPYRVLLSPIRIDQEPYTLMARINLVESADLVTNIALLFFCVMVLLFAGLYFITRRLSSTLWKPFYSTLNKIEGFELGKGEKPRFGKADIQEFARLNASVERLLERNISTYEEQQEFIENAAHELQTPLATFQAKLDVLVQQIPLTNELGETFNQLHEATSRLIRINKNLLLLSKIENQQYPASEIIHLDVLLSKQLDFLREQAEGKGILVQVESLEPHRVNANKTLVEIAIQNLLLNALRHNHAQGRIVVELQNNHLSISNTGTAGPLDIARLFQRFSSQVTDGGNGLGLSIIKRISDLYGWQVSYRFDQGLHIFELILENSKNLPNPS